LKHLNALFSEIENFNEQSNQQTLNGSKLLPKKLSLKPR